MTLRSMLFLLLGAAAPGCVSLQECTLLGCSDGVGVVLNGLIPKVSASLPVTLSVCLDATCSSFQLTATGGNAPPACTDAVGTNVECSIDGQGTLVLTTLPLPSGTAAGSVVSVHATATNKSGSTVFDATTPVTLVASQPNGPGCGPTCDGAQAIFTP